MKNFKFFAWIWLFFYASWTLCGNDDNQQNIKELLLDAQKKTQNISFSSITPIMINGEVQKIVKLYRKVSDNGEVNERVDNVFPSKKNEFYIHNPNGVYVTIASKTFKMQSSPSNRSVIYNSALNKFNDLSTYSIINKKYKNKYCDEVTVTIKDDIETHSELLKRLSNITDTEEYITKRMYVKRKYLIDKVSRFIYSCEFFNKEDQKKLSVNWGEVDFDTPIDDSLFDIVATSLLIVNNHDIEQNKLIKGLFFVSEPRNEVAKTNIVEELDARTFIFNAMRKSSKTNFKAVFEQQLNEKLKRIITSHQSVGNDIKIRERTEYVYSNGWSETYISANNETLAIFDNTKIKVPFVISNRRFIYGNVAQDVIEDATYSIEDSKSYNGEKCYLVTVKIPTDATYVNERVLRIQKNSKKKKEEILEKLAFLKTFVVGKDSNFIYSCTLYNLLGRKVLEAEWGRVTFDPSMSENLFEMPQSGVRFISAPQALGQAKERASALFHSRQNTKKRR